ncbi:MAG: hypothetical protein JW900_11440 [Anaerolineae bacterium]|nr:hypothetical protein [Anaerolineae bacterium]
MSDRVTRSEWRWAAVVALVVVAFSTVPYIAGHLAQTPDLRFAGAVYDLEDYHSYLARMWQGYRGSWRFQLLFTPQPHEGVYIQPFHVLLGHLARLAGLGLPLTYQVARVGLGFLMLLTVYRFIARFTPAGGARRAAFLLAATASGLGWLVEVICPTPAGGISPIDFWLIDAYVFFSLFIVPHFSAAIALLLSLYDLLLRQVGAAGQSAPQPPLWRDILLAVLLSWGLGLVHPYTLLLADLVPALYLAGDAVARRRLPWRPLILLAAMGAAQAPLLLYEYQLFATSPIFQSWAAQNLTLSPPPLHYLLGYGLVALLALWGVRSALRATRRASFLLIWLAAVAVLAYLPWGLQRRFLEGVHVALCILAGYGLAEGLMPALAHPLGRAARVLRYNARRLRWLVQAALLALTMLSNLYLVMTYTAAAATRHPALFHPAGEVAALEWLNGHSAWDATLLAAYETGNWAAGAIGRRVVVGHWAETVNCEAKEARVASFYAAATPDAERRALLEQWNVQYVYLGPHERALGNFDPAAAPYLEAVFQNDDAAIYRVVE